MNSSIPCRGDLPGSYPRPRPPGKTGFLKMYCVKKTSNSARSRDGKGGRSRDEGKAAAFAANKTDLNRTQAWAREVHLPLFCVQGPASRMSPEVDSAAQQLNPWTSYDPDALSLRVFLSMGSVCVVRSNLCRVKFRGLSRFRRRAGCPCTPPRFVSRKVRDWNI